MQKVVEMTEKYLDEVQAKPGEYSFCIGYGYDYEEAVGFREMLKDLIRERLGIEEIGIYQIGATIGVAYRTVSHRDWNCPDAKV